MTPTAWTVAVLSLTAALGVVAAAVFAARCRSLTDVPLAGRTVVARAASYAALAAGLAVAVAVGQVGVAVLVLVLGTLGLWEWARMGDLPIHHRAGLLIANVVLVVAIHLQGVQAADWLVGGIVLVGLLWPVIRADTGRAVRDLGFAAIGFLSIAVMLAHAVAIGNERGEAGVVLVAALALSCAGSDVGAFLVGRRFGRTPLAPKLSPAKTRAGLVGNVLGAAVGLLPLAPAVIGAFGATALAYCYAVLLVPIVAIGSVWGDLFESAVKREVGVKDAGGWLPGFGGILDRIDSLLITLPLAYWTLRLADLYGVTA